MSDRGARSRHRLDDRFRITDGDVHLTGIQALARLPLDQRRHDSRAGLDTAVFISGYEGSPLAGYDLELGRRAELLDEHRVIHRPGLNEELAATAVQGTQLAATVDGFQHDGVAGIWYGKAPGLDRASDAIRHANLMGTYPSGGVLALVGDDAVATSSTVPSGSEPLLADLGLPTLCPSNPQDILDLGLHGIALSRACGLWVGMKLATNVADGSGTVRVHSDRPVPVSADFPDNGDAYRHQVTARLLQPALGELERSKVGARLRIARHYARANRLNAITVCSPHDRIGLVAAGKSYLDLRQALHQLGLDDAELSRRGVRLLKLGMIHPLDEETVIEFTRGLREIMVVEEKRSFVEAAIKELLYGRGEAPDVTGKYGPGRETLLPAWGELDPGMIAERLAGRLQAHGDFPSVERWLEARRPRPRNLTLPLVQRTPYFCSGCPHNRSAKAPSDALVGGGIGCHGMALLMDEGQVGNVVGVTQMGGEGAQWIGMQPFLDRDHFVQNLGDGTFHHSGSLAIRAAVAAGVNITFKLLYNSAVAMTGGQRTVGEMSVPDLTRMLASEGVRRIIVTTDDPKKYRRARLAPSAKVWHRDRLMEAQEVLRGVTGVSVLIHDQECAAEKRRKRKRGLADDPATRIFINERVCEGCGDCGHVSNCLSVQPVDTEFGRKTRIHQPSCNKDYSCLDGDCPSFLTVIPSARAGSEPHASPPPALDLPAPRPRVPHDRFAVRIAGIGGTGVVTLAQIIATAATISGRRVRGLDQTGLAQKGGAVVSDLKITTGDWEQANKLADGECDLYLGSDPLVAADVKNLAVLDPTRTVAVVSTTVVPTGGMVVDPALSFPNLADLKDRIAATTRASDAVFLDVGRLAEELFGDDQYANMMLAGAAYQAGALPLPLDAIEAAIELNGAAVRTNLDAFHRGRQAIVRREAASEADRALADVADASEATGAAPGLRGIVQASPGSELARLVAIRVDELVKYQNARYARRYAETVERVRLIEARQVPGSSALAEGVARGLHKLMAYKDEYEVARLCLEPTMQAEIEKRFGAGAKYRYRLHPPMLRALGLRKKISLGPWSRPILRSLYAMRGLRGTPLDVFGHTRVRRIERELINEYRAVLDQVLHRLSADNHATAVEISNLPDLVRGYEQIKLDNVERYRERLRPLVVKLNEAPAEPLSAS